MSVVKCHDEPEADLQCGWILLQILVWRLSEAFKLWALNLTIERITFAEFCDPGFQLVQRCLIKLDAIYIQKLMQNPMGW